MYSVERILHRMHLHPDGFTALTYNYFISQFAMGMVGIFGAVFLFEMFDSWYWGLVLVAGFYIVQRVMVMLLLPVAAELLGKIGYRRMMTLALVALVLRLFVLMETTPDRLWILGLAALAGGFYIAAYYLAFHCLFLDDNNDEQIGTQIGFLSLVRRLALVVSPFAAGLVVEQFGFGVLFGVGIFLLLVSLVPLFAMPHHKHSMRGFSMKKVMGQYEEHPHFTKAVLYFNVSQAVLDIYWPLYLLLILKSYAVLGAVSSGVMIASGVSVYAMGKVYDKRPLHKLFPIVSLLVSVTWGMRFLAQSVSTIVTADMLGRLLNPLWWMKIRRFELRFGERINSMVFGVAHELVTSVGIILGLFVGVILVLFSGGQWGWLLLPGIVGVLFSAWAAKDK